MNQKELSNVQDLKGVRNYQGGYFKTLISPEDSGQSMALLDLVLPRGAEPPPHIHTLEDETFYVVDGQLEVRIGETLTIVRSGDAIFAPRNIPHSFKILSPSVHMLNLITPGSLWKYFLAFSEPCSGEPKVETNLQPPPREHIEAMLNVLTNDYKLKFLS